MNESCKQSKTQCLLGNALLVLFAATCLLVVCAWQARTNTTLWGLAFGAFALHDLVVLLYRRRAWPLRHLQSGAVGARSRGSSRASSCEANRG